MKKRIILGIIAITVTVCLCACGKKESANNQKPKATETVKETPTPTPKPTEEVSSEAVTVSEDAVSVTNDAVTEEPQTEQIQTEISNITELNKIMYAIQAVNTRSGPGTSYGKIGSLTRGQAVQVTGQDNGSGWYRIILNGVECFVSGKYLSDTQIDTNVSASNNNTYSADNSTPTQNQQPQNQQPQQNPTVVEQPVQQVQTLDIDKTKADIIATLRAKGCLTPEEDAINKYGQEFWNEILSEWGQLAYSNGMGWFEGRVRPNTYWDDINSIASNYSFIGRYWIIYVRTEENDLIFRCYVAN